MQNITKQYSIKDNPAISRRLIQARASLTELKGIFNIIPNQAILVNTLNLQEAQDSFSIGIVTTQVSEVDVIYFNGSYNLPNLRKDHEYQKTCLIEEAFHQYMSDVGV